MDLTILYFRLSHVFCYCELEDLLITILHYDETTERGYCVVSLAAFVAAGGAVCDDAGGGAVRALQLGQQRDLDDTVCDDAGWRDWKSASSDHRRIYLFDECRIRCHTDTCAAKAV